MLIQSFQNFIGITAIAYYLNCPEPEIMRKIRELDLYTQFNRLSVSPENPHETRIAQLRSKTPLLEKAPPIWSDVQTDALFWLFCAGEDITEIALTLDCPETVIMEQILQRGYYRALSNFSLFEYCSERNRSTFKEM